METKRQQFERETGQSPYLNPLKEVHGYAEWLEKQLEVRAISDQEIDIMGNKRTDLENVGERIAFKKGMLALRDLMNDRANGKEAADDSFCDCVIPKPIDPYHPIDKHICRDCSKTIPTNKTE